MTPAQLQVRAFHEAMGATIGETPAIRDAELRAKLILEEAIETVVALVGWDRAYTLVNHELGEIDNPNCERYAVEEEDAGDLVKVIDGLADLQYVLLGTAVACGIDLEPFANEVHESNMTKFPVTMRADGKVMKGPNFRPPRIAELLAEMTKGAGR